MPAITLHLVEASELPAPWVGKQTTWSIDLSADVPESSGDVAPYPLLVSLGLDEAGSLVLVNLEDHGRSPSPGTLNVQTLWADT